MPSGLALPSLLTSLFSPLGPCLLFLRPLSIPRQRPRSSPSLPHTPLTYSPNLSLAGSLLAPHSGLKELKACSLGQLTVAVFVSLYLLLALWQLDFMFDYTQGQGF